MSSQHSSSLNITFKRYGDDSSADDKDEEVKEPDHKKDSLQSLVENTRFCLKRLVWVYVFVLTQKNVSAWIFPRGENWGKKEARQDS